MKNNIAFLYNPFNRVAGWKAFGWGLIISIAATIVGYFCNIGFNGAIDIHYMPGMTLLQAFVYQLLAVLSIIGVFYLAALIFAKGTRFQDIAGTTLLARYPYFLAAFLGLLMPNVDIQSLIFQYMANPELGINMSTPDTTRFVISAILMAVCSIWFIILLYNAFKVSTGLKGGKCIGIFAVSLFVAELVSLLLILGASYLI